MKTYLMELMIFCFIFLTLSVKSGFTDTQTVYSIKVVKSSPQMAKSPPLLRIIDNPDAWEVINKDARWQGENLWEVYFNIATSQEQPAMPHIEILTQGLDPSRVIVGKTDVSYEYQDGNIRFQLVDDKSRGQLMQTDWTDPSGGLPIHLMHNWEIRKVGPWDPWPENAIRAVNNFLFAAREALKFMEKQNPGKDRFEGQIVLMGFETTSTRGHVDNPAHIHIMLYVPGYNPGSCVPHLYVNEDGLVYSNSYVKIGVPGSGKKFGPGEICSMDDLNGRVGLEIMITRDGGLMLRANSSAESYHLRPHKMGAHLGVLVFQGESRICTVTTSDDASRGEMTATMEYSGEYMDQTHTEEIQYDPFTGRLRKK